MGISDYKKIKTYIDLGYEVCVVYESEYANSDTIIKEIADWLKEAK